MTYDEIRHDWNAQADEKVEWAFAFATTKALENREVMK